MILGRNLDWNIVFEVNLATTYSLYLSHISSFLSLLVSFIFLGITLWIVVLRQSQIHKSRRNGHLKTVKRLASCLIFTYLLAILFFRLPEQYTNLSSNMVLIYFLKLVTYYWRKIFLVPIQMDQAVFDRVAQLIRAPAVDISRPLATLKQPIKDVFIIVLESIRADAMPLNESLANAVNLNFTPNTTPETVTPLLSSLWANSVRTIASVASSYTLKSSQYFLWYLSNQC
ncbi:unnamed protein product [Rotaria socialis]|uniref:Uncharacterized protein n=1 Tax=Rotaria socialis TaxID=392032 RepID=A0A820RA77_9BILA|nr:unnamed protein product [Rotaria socialis]CAF3548289.1 unnamed protein product [Rotaria socialis]CAF4432043.1 unnamed protein product [Rotaria socialis]CAF4482757.1 unnamed protein product [Rotaria socialis]